MKSDLLYGICFTSIFILAYFYQEAFASTPTYNLGKLVTGSVYTNNPNIITIDLSNQCLALVKHNDTSDCPSYHPIVKYDNTNPVISGNFITTNGFFHRGFVATALHYKMYDPHKTLIMVDPDYNALIHSKEIIIVPHGFVYTNPNDVVTNGTRTEYHDRYVYNCQTAKIVYSDYLLNDTINYLKSGCTKTTFNEKVKITPIQHQIDITKTQSYKNQQWYKEAKKVTQNCIIKCKPLKDPNSRF